ncbi:hypothetical protein BCR37DRAFT_381322 [Protomyces lactucae-debilis]|uniref:Secreted protein n=1 Tax=Protomyces lactucae-debilis TaxID=2754530 RepID=A0A1Y2F7P4_PROLT|nr:uncharacterized protein BCR37DRAFT_381322 [Protomyces lactucae-debilis]ORY79891.1 hypothetical protein BCR37DRAFT_381322 [Protomyces lactucae-debilis]
MTCWLGVAGALRFARTTFARFLGCCTASSSSNCDAAPRVSSKLGSLMWKSSCACAKSEFCVIWVNGKAPPCVRPSKSSV